MALATAIELGIEVENEVIDVYQAEFLDPINPLRQIPTLLLDDGRPIYDSRVIVAYLCSLRPGRRLNPVEDRWDVQTRWSLAIGMMDISVQRQMESLRPQGERSQILTEKYDSRIANVVQKLESLADHICSDAPRVDRLATAVALEYIDFRICRDWRNEAPRLNRWLESETLRPFMALTRPKARVPAASKQPAVQDL